MSPLSSGFETIHDFILKDVNGDDIPDILLNMFEEVGWRFDVVLNDGNGSFSNSYSLATSERLNFSDPFDFDGDSDLDI